MFLGCTFYTQKHRFVPQQLQNKLHYYYVYFNTQAIQLNHPILLIKATVLQNTGDLSGRHCFHKNSPEKSVSQQLRRTNGNGATIPSTRTATGTRPFLAPLPAPGAQGPAQVTTQWAGRMRGTAGHPEIAPLVRNQKGNQKESGRGGRGWEPEQRMQTHGARERRRVGMVGWSGSGCV